MQPCGTAEPRRRRQSEAEGRSRIAEGGNVGGVWGGVDPTGKERRFNIGTLPDQAIACLI